MNPSIRSIRLHDDEALVAKKVTGLPPEDVDHISSLDIPQRQKALADGLTPWELLASSLCIALLSARLSGDQDGTEKAVNAIGVLVSEALLKGEYCKLRIISQGLVNLQNDKGFIAKRGRRKSNDYALVLIAFFELQKEGITQPSQTEVAERLRLHGCDIPSEQLSKAFGKLELKQLSSDAREAASLAGKRKRGKR
jgi:hypothetical protein